MSESSLKELLTKISISTFHVGRQCITSEYQLLEIKLGEWVIVLVEILNAGCG